MIILFIHFLIDFGILMILLNSLSQWSVMAIPLIFSMSPVILALFKGQVKTSWRISFMVTWLALTAALAAIATYGILSINQAEIASPKFLHINSLSLLMLMLISIIALVIVRFSKNYIHHEPGEKAYQCWFMLTLVSVTLVITTNHFVIFLFAWIMISIGLHQLLMFYPNRPRAALAAHKKFIISRIADICMIVAISLIFISHKSLWISDVLEYYQTDATLTQADHIAAVLFALAAILKSAQLPLHGWLMQVMEAPTPVSALLHAGIINMGGFLMILLSPLILKSPAAEWLLMIVGGITAVVASLIMMTRISIKVMLAWSTCAQMGFMLLECGLGLYELALLHLIAHSFYKAYTFLSSGEAVNHFIRDNLIKIKHHKNRTYPSIAQWLIGGLLGLVIVASVFTISHTFNHQLTSFIAIGSILTMSITLLLSENLNAGVKHLLNLLMTAIGIASLYAIWHGVFGQLFISANIGLVATIWVLVLFITLFLSYIMLCYYPNSAFSKWLYLRLFAGFYLDEWSTKITMMLWPAKLPAKTFTNKHY